MLTQSASPSLDSDYRLGPGDSVEISVFGVPEYKHVRRIRESGTIDLPLIGSIEVSGMTTAELRSTVQDYLSAGLILEPEVLVVVQEHRSGVSFVLGEVNSPGQFQISRPTKLVDMLAMAGGLTHDAGDVAIVHCSDEKSTVSGEPTSAANAQNLTASNGDMTALARRVSLDDLLENGDSSSNVAITGGCVVQVPVNSPDLYYVVGDVVMPGTFEIDEDQELCLTRALAKAGGAAENGKKEKGRPCSKS